MTYTPVTNMSDDEEWEDVKPRKRNPNRGDDYSEEPDFSDSEDFVDDVSDEDLMSDILNQKPKRSDGFSSIIVVDNVPTVAEDRLPKLKAVMMKIFSKAGEILSEHYPTDDKGVTKGFAFLEYETAEAALASMKSRDNFKLDKSHTFKVNLLTDFDKFIDVSGDWTPPPKQQYKQVGNLHYHLEEENCQDQFSVIHAGGSKTSIYLNTHNEPHLIEERKRWTETYTRWSPQGTYLATFHAKGIALWGGENFKQIQRFSHEGVQLIDFSPCERYLVTFSPLQVENNSAEPTAIIIWDVFSGKQKRSFHADMSESEDRQWPIFKWSHEGEFFARKSNGVLSVYETPSFGLLDKKSFKVPGIKDIFWSPNGNQLAYWVPEHNDIPARVVILEIPSRRELRVKNLFNVSDIRLNWQKQGRFLCVKVDRYSKTKKANISNFEIFHIKEKQIPVDVVELKEQVTAFAWEPTGAKFCCLHGDSPRTSASFYEIKAGEVMHIETMERKAATHIFWSPAGQFVLLAGLQSSLSQLEFIDTNDMSVMATTEHLMMSDIEWDPTGRYLTTVVSWWAHKIDNAYWMWSFQGRLLRKQPMEGICQLLWRPRPKSLLKDDDIKKVKKEIKKYGKMFEDRDRILQSRVSKDILDKRRGLIEEYLSYRSNCENTHREQTPYRRELRNGINTDEVDSHLEDFDEFVVELLIDEEDIIIDTSTTKTRE